MYERRYRDPVHDIIVLDGALPEHRLAADLVDTPDFQRLRRIKQLGLALFAYQGAEHSRFTHSLGVMHVMNRVLARLGKGIAPEIRAAAVAGALTHDLGHGPFSHVMEKVLGFHHEDWTIRILRDPDTAVHQVLAGMDGALPEAVVSLVSGTFKPAWIGQLVSSQLDCDRFDYLLRDSLMTGAKYGRYDLEWIIASLGVDAVEDSLFVRGRGIYAVEEYLQARYYMFRQVYFHHTLRAAENMLVSIMRRAVHLAGQGRLGFIVPDTALAKLLFARELTTREFLELDDNELMFSIKRWRHEADPILGDLAARFIDRRLFKSIDLPTTGEADGISDRVREIVAAAGFDPDYYLLHDNASDIPYFGPYTPDSDGVASRIFVEVGKLHPVRREITEVSDVVRGMKAYQIARLCFPSEVRDAVVRLFQ